MSIRVAHSAARSLPARIAPTPAQGVTALSQSVPYPERSVPFPADLLDRAMPSLTDTEWRLLCVVVRQTLGWQSGDGGRKGRDWLTQAQLAGRAGRSRRAVSQAVEGLVRKGIIRVQTEAGEPLETPEARRGYGGRHWFLLRPEPADGQPSGPSTGATTSGSTTMGIAETSQGGARYAQGGAESAGGGAESAGGGAESAEKNLPTTKENKDKKKSFSGGEPCGGSPPEEDLLKEGSASQERASDDDACAENAHDAASAEGVSQETPQVTGEAARPPSLPPRKSPTETAYLRQLVQDDEVDYDEVRRFLLRYQDACRTLFPQQEPPPLAWGREGKLVAGLLRQHPYARLLRLLKRFLSRIDQGRTDLNERPRHQPQPPGHGNFLHDHILVDFSRAIPDMIAQGRQEVAQGVHRTVADFPIKIWREEEAATTHGATARPVPDADWRPDSTITPGPAKNWQWDSKTERWMQAKQE